MGKGGYKVGVFGAGLSAPPGEAIFTAEYAVTVIENRPRTEVPQINNPEKPGG